MTWCVKREYCEKNYFSGLSNNKAKKKKNSEERFPWYEDQLTAIFSHKVFTELKFTHSHYYWHPLIALHGGQRMNEISQLYVDDIVLEEGIWCFKHTEERKDQRLKTIYSERHIPIHSKLIELGFLKFIQRLKANKETRVFPELSYTSKAGYSRDVSKWFGRFRNSNNLKIEGIKQDFHSFRHGVSQHLKYAEVQEEKVADILGHEHANITFGRYGMAHPLKTIQNVVETLNFDDFLVDVKSFC
jgi:integrase